MPLLKDGLIPKNTPKTGTSRVLMKIFQDYSGFGQKLDLKILDKRPLMP